MADNRYRKGIFVGNRRQRTPLVSHNNPAAYGWQWLYFNKEYRLDVWQMGTYKLMRHTDLTQVRWVVENTETGQQWLDPNELLKISRLIQAGKYENERKMSLAEQAKIQALWEAANPPDDYGLPERTLPLEVERK